jgi:hypothetical protein
MGWLFYNSTNLLPNGEVERKKEIDEGFSDGYTVLKSSIVGTVYYGAIKNNTTGDVFGYVCLTSSDKRRGYNFGYKSMDETCGPNESKCPLSILKLLTPTDSKWANEWRERCRNYHEQKKSPTAYKNLPIGTKVIWTVPHNHFNRGKKGEKIELEKARASKGPSYWYNRAGNWRTNPKHVNMSDCEIVA